MLKAIEAPLYDIGVLSERGMLPGLNGMLAAAVPFSAQAPQCPRLAHLYPPIGGASMNKGSPLVASVHISATACHCGLFSIQSVINIQYDFTYKMYAR